jgi:hypothetical protein
VAVAHLILGASAACAPWWHAFSSESGGFSIQMPWPPEKKVETAETSWGLVDVHWFAVAMGGTFDEYIAFFSVSYWELPASIAESEYLPALEDAKKRLLESLHGSPNEEHEVTLPDRPDVTGLQMDVTMSDGNVAAVRLFIANEKLFRVMVVGGADIVASTEGERFLESFRVN